MKGNEQTKPERCKTSKTIESLGSRSLRIVRGAIEIDLILFILLSPFLYGGVDPHFAILASINTIVLVLLSAFVLMNGLKVQKFILVIPALLLSICLFQLIPLPPALLELLAPGIAKLKAPLAMLPESSQWQSIAIALPEVSAWGGKLAAMFSLLLAAVIIAADRKVLIRILTVITITALIQFTYGYIEYLAGKQILLQLPRKYYSDFLSGTFVNRDHFANFLALGFGAAFGLTSATYYMHSQGRTSKFKLSFTVIATIILGVAIVFTGCRGCTIATGFGLIIGIATLILVSVKPNAVGLGLFIGVAVFSIVLMFASDPLLNRFLELRLAFEGNYTRPAFWLAAISMGLASPVLGVGWGSFEYAFPVFAKEAGISHIDSLSVAHAHCDWAEWFASFGFVGTIIIALLFAFAFRSFTKSLETISSTRKFALCGVVLALVAYGVHSIVDFPLAIPATAGTAAILFGLLLSGSQAKGKQSNILITVFVIPATLLAIFSFGYHIDGLRDRPTGNMYPGIRSDLLANEAGNIQEIDDYVSESRLICDALQNNPTDPYLWISLSSLPINETDFRINCLNQAITLVPSSYYIRKNALRISAEMWTKASKEQRKLLEKNLNEIISKADGEEEVKLAGVVLEDFGSYEIVSHFLNKNEEIPLLCSLFDTRKQRQFLYIISHMELSKQTDVLSDSRVRKRLAKANKSQKWQQIISSNIEQIARIDPDLLEVFLFFLIDSCESVRASHLASEFASSLSPNSALLLQLNYFSVSDAAKLLEETKHKLATTTSKKIPLLLKAIDRQIKAGNWGTAISILENLHKVNASEYRFSIRLAALYYKRGDYKDTAKLLEQLKKTDKLNQRQRKMLINCYTNLGWVEKLRNLQKSSPQ